MPVRRLVTLLGVLTVVVLATGPAAGQGSPAEALPMPSGPQESSVKSSTDPCPPSRPACCPAPPRVTVCVPPPEVVFKQAKPCAGFHRPQPKAAPCVAACPTPPGGGLVSFNMSLSAPFMMNATGMSAAFSGNGLGLGQANPALAAALGLPGVGNGAAVTPSAADMLLLRTLLARSTGASADNPIAAVPPTTDDVDARIRRLHDAITAEMNNEIATVQTQLKRALQQVLQASNDVQALKKRLDDMEEREKKRER